MTNEVTNAVAITNKALRSKKIDARERTAIVDVISAIFQHPTHMDLDINLIMSA